jgi:hypothetical protein
MLTKTSLIVLSVTAIVTLALPQTAYARINGPVADSFSAGCLLLQNKADALRAEYADPNTTDARRDEILTELRNTGQTWIQIGCRAVFGSISIRTVNYVPLVDTGTPHHDLAVAAPAGTGGGPTGPVGSPSFL